MRYVSSSGMVTEWVSVSDWIQPYSDLVRAEIDKSAAQYAKEKGLTPRDCK